MSEPREIHPYMHLGRNTPGFTDFGPNVQRIAENAQDADLSQQVDDDEIEEVLDPKDEPVQEPVVSPPDIILPENESTSVEEKPVLKLAPKVPGGVKKDPEPGKQTSSSEKSPGNSKPTV